MKYLFLLVSLWLAASNLNAQSMKIDGKELKKLASYMAGDFNSNEQADLDKSYFHILLRMKPIWKDRADGYWFYVEQAVESSADKPYRQRVYHLYLHDDTTAVSKVYEIPGPERFIGAWQNEELLGRLPADSLIDRQGCAIYLHRVAKDIFRGSTPGKECLSTLRNAAYATSEVTIAPGRLESWDRGWNAEDHQVWGAEKGGYVFIRQGRLK